MKLIQSLLEMAKRASPDGFYKLGKEMYGAEKVKSLTWPEIKAIADKHDVLIPAYLRSQKVGRGRFNIVPADHADAKEPAKSAPLKKPEAPRDVARKNDEVTDEVLKSALMFVKNKMLKHASSYSMHRPVEETSYRGKKAFEFEIRDWGQWVVPDGEEDDGDYDWEVLTDKYRKILKDIRDEAKHEYPSIDFNVDIGEKNWITVIASPAKTASEAMKAFK